MPRAMTAAAMTATKLAVTRDWSERSTALALGEGVAGAAHGQDVMRLVGPIFQLLAQVADVDGDGRLVAEPVAIVTHGPQEGLAREDAAGVAGQLAQDLELGRGQLDRAAGPCHAVPLHVDDEVTAHDGRRKAGRGVVAVGAPQQ